MFEGWNDFEYLFSIVEILLDIHNIDSSEIAEFFNGYELMLLLI